jgi:hypothetical protein
MTQTKVPFDQPNGTNGHSRGMSLHIEPEVLRPLVEEVVAEAIARLESARGALGGKLAYSEGEAARLLSLEPWVLRDERQRGRIQASQIVGNRIRYTHDDLVRYLAGRRWSGNRAR